MFHSAQLGLRIVQHCVDAPPGWSPLPLPEEVTVRMISAQATLACNLPVGSCGLLLDCGGDFVTDRFHDQQTTINMVTANALQLLAWQYLTQLSTLLSAPSRRQVASMLRTVIQLHAEDQQLQQDAASELSAEEQGLPSSQAGGSSSSSAGGDDALKGASFDRIAAAANWFKQNAVDFEFQEEDAEDMADVSEWTASGGFAQQHEILLKASSASQRPQLTASYVIQQLEALFEEVFDTEYELLGVPAIKRIITTELLEEWAAAHELRRQRNELGAHPLNHIATGERVAQLFEEAAAEPHPSLKRIPHVAQLAAIAAKEHVTKLGENVQKRRSAKGKRMFKLKPANSGS